MTERLGDSTLVLSLSECVLKGNLMRALLLLALLLGVAVLGGCATMTQSPADVRAAYARSFEYDMRQLADDCNYVLMLDRPSRLSKWVMR